MWSIVISLRVKLFALLAIIPSSESKCQIFVHRGIPVSDLEAAAR